ncbi:MAG: hypothetical protein R3B84_02980 [Zavarzinella sp.]
MKNSLTFSVTALLVIVCYGFRAQTCGAELPPLPDKEGFAGSFAGVSNGALLVAGGANFPDKKPWEGGTKVWYDQVYVLEKPTGKWQIAGKLPHALGYGAAVQFTDRLICIGGSDATQHYKDVFFLDWKDGKLQTVKLPELPIAMANCCGVMVGNHLFVAGGLSSPMSNKTLNRIFCMHLTARDPEWKEIAPCPGGGRMLAVAANLNDQFWLISGVDLIVDNSGKPQRKYLQDAYSYHMEKGWKRHADLPWPTVAAPSPAPVHENSLFVLGGDDGTQVAVPPNQHQGFQKTILRYSTAEDKWLKIGKLKLPTVTTSTAFWNQQWVIPTGETRPGVRTPIVGTFRP